jgi:hypothetical protein
MAPRTHCRMGQWVSVRDAVARRAGVSVDQRVVIPRWSTRISMWLRTPFGFEITLAVLGSIVAAGIASSWAWLGLLLPLLIVNTLVVPSFYSLDPEQRAARRVWIGGSVTAAGLILGVIAVGGPVSGVLAVAAVGITAIADEHMHNRAREAERNPG